MADIKVTKMVMKVDLQCSKCYKKIKRVLCRYPREIRDQVYDEKNNTVTIKVVCCSPECVKEKIIRGAGKTVESIEILQDKPTKKVVTFADLPNKPAKPLTLATAPKPSRQAPPPNQPAGPSLRPPNFVVPGYPLPPPPLWPVPMYPSGICCCCYYYKGRPCYPGMGPMCQGCNRGCTVSGCCEYFSEENPSGCSIM